MIIGVCSDVGKIRGVNQDSFFFSDLKELPLFVVADGMGGHNAGEIASNMAIETIKEILNKHYDMLCNKEMEIPKFINTALDEANKKIHRMSTTNHSLEGMGTTITLGIIEDKELFIGHIGDSRAYLYRNNQLIQVTQDHSLVAELVRNGTISYEEAQKHPQKNIITRALGTQEDVKVDILSRQIEANDIILLCTDGLTNMVSEDKIKNILANSKDLQKSSEILVTTANELGGFDNTTAMIIKVC